MKYVIGAVVGATAIVGVAAWWLFRDTEEAVEGGVAGEATEAPVEPVVEETI